MCSDSQWTPKGCNRDPVSYLTITHSSKGGFANHFIVSHIQKLARSCADHYRCIDTCIYRILILVQCTVEAEAVEDAEVAVVAAVVVAAVAEVEVSARQEDEVDAEGGVEAAVEDEEEEVVAGVAEVVE